MMREFRTDDLVINTVGEPGSRVFWIQIRSDGDVVSLRVEKQQVQVLATQLIELLDRLVDEVGPDPIEPIPKQLLREPLVEDFVVGPMAIGHDAANDRVMLQFEPFDRDDVTGSPEDLDAFDDDQRDGVRVFLHRQRARSLATHALEVVAGGRPPCPLCGRPLDTAHVCARTNGRVRDTL
jgi:uncharacterized repeat protein (TIGR03847 family)